MKKNVTRNIFFCNNPLKIEEKIPMQHECKIVQEKIRQEEKII